MQVEHPLLKQAITAARAGHELTARDMFLRVVESEPGNELAWMWLTGLMDNVDDRIYACERLLGINPANVSARLYFEQLLVEKQNTQITEYSKIGRQVGGIRNTVREGRKDLALWELRELTQNPQLNHPDAWRLLAELSPELDERVRALERLAALVPTDLRVQEELEQARHYQQHPIHQAELYEEQGEIDNALLAYRMAALKPESKEQWNKIYWKIVQLEDLLHEKIAHVSPAVSIARLTAGPPLVYFMFALVQAGINPFANANPLLWFGLVWVTLGGFMAALAAVRSHNRLWVLLFKDVGASGTQPARRMMATAGWMLILLPHVMLLVSAWYRLMDYVRELINQSYP